MSSNDLDVEENLYGCYLLYCLNEKYRGHTYIGYTVNPLRRIKQHNKGIRAGGAKRTNNKGPWEMALIVHGFPNSICALKFEWAWQNPSKSRRLRRVRSKRARETAFQYRVYIMTEMLLKGPWKRLPLTIRWLNPKYAIDFDPTLCPPSHMPIVYGLVDAKKVTSSPSKKSSTGTSPIKNTQKGLEVAKSTRCSVCRSTIKDDRNKINCVNPACTMVSHVTCLADRFCHSSSFIPVMGECPACRMEVLWGDLIKHKNGCYRTLQAPDADDNAYDDDWTDLLRIE